MLPLPSQNACEVETHLAQKDEKMKALEGGLAVLLAQLLEELRVQRRETEEALVQLEEQGGLLSSQLQREQQEAQTLQAKTQEERDEAVAELQRATGGEREDATALRELQESTEAERSDGRRSRSELLGLQTRLERRGAVFSLASKSWNGGPVSGRVRLCRATRRTRKWRRRLCGRSLT